MTGKTRYFLAGSALVFVVGLSISLVAYYGGMPQGLFSSGGGPAELKFVPADAAVVAYANVKQVMDSELRQRLRQFGGPTDEGRNQIKNETGIDIETDIDYVVAFMGPKDPAATSQISNGLVLARGRFDQNRLEAFARDKGAQVGEYKGKHLVKPPVRESDEGRERKEPAMAVAFLDNGLVAMGSEAMIRRVIDGAGPEKNALSNVEMMKLVRDVDDASMWAVGRFDAISGEAKLPQEVTGKIPPITWFAASGRVNGGVQVMLKAETKDEAAANNLRDIVRGFLALAKMQAGNLPEAQALWPSVEMGGTGKTVSLSFGVTNQLIDAMTAKGGPGKVEKRKESGKVEPPAAPDKPTAPKK